jgi:hypothetical protein
MPYRRRQGPVHDPVAQGGQCYETLSWLQYQVAVDLPAIYLSIYLSIYLTGRCGVAAAEEVEQFDDEAEYDRVIQHVRNTVQRNRDIL